MSRQGKTAAIIHGWAEGPWQSSRFVKELERAGYEVTKNAKDSDIVFAHSAGCYLVPKDTRAKLVVLAGLPYWPGRSMASGVLRKLISEIRYHRRNKGLGWWLNKMAHNGWYIVTRPQKTYYLLTRHRLDNLPSAETQNVVLVRASSDTMLEPNAAKVLATTKKYQMVELPGAHDDCWFDPKPYINLIKNSG